jgi:hypothetical protein
MEKKDEIEDKIILSLGRFLFQQEFEVFVNQIEFRKKFTNLRKSRLILLKIFFLKKTNRWRIFSTHTLLINLAKNDSNVIEPVVEGGSTKAFSWRPTMFCSLRALTLLHCWRSCIEDCDWGVDDSCGSEASWIVTWILCFDFRDDLRMAGELTLLTILCTKVASLATRRWSNE